MCRTASRIVVDACRFVVLIIPGRNAGGAIVVLRLSDGDCLRWFVLVVKILSTQLSLAFARITVLLVSLLISITLAGIIAVFGGVDACSEQYRDECKCPPCTTVDAK